MNDLYPPGVSESDIDAQFGDNDEQVELEEETDEE